MNLSSFCVTLVKIAAMIKKLSGEVWKHLPIEGGKLLLKKYALSSAGRIASYTEDILKDGNLISGSVTTGYKTLNLHRPGYNSTIYIHREMAKLFLKKKSPKHKYVVHINHKRDDNRQQNLSWATLQEMIAHQQKSPAKIAYKALQASRNIGRKLTASQVKAIKKILSSKNRSSTIKQLADKYGVSQMTIYRIKRGENWGGL